MQSESIKTQESLRAIHEDLKSKLDKSELKKLK
jgi:hypothetical protein